MTLPVQLATGPTTFDECKVDIESIIWQLSRLARFNGAAWYIQWSEADVAARALFDNGLVLDARGCFDLRDCIANAVYSVAQHSCLMYDFGKAQGWTKRQLIFALIHDAPEALYGDKTKPVQVFERECVEELYEPLDPSCDESCPAEQIDKRLGIVDHKVWKSLGQDYYKNGRPYAYLDNELRAVWNADERIVADEFMAFGWDWPEGVVRPEPLGVEISPWGPPSEVADEYRERLKEAELA